MKTYALSVRQPWAWAIVNGYKDIENRSWPLPSQFVGQRIAIHAGKQLDKSGIAFLMERGIILPRHISLGLVRMPQLDLGAIIGSVEIVDCVLNSTSPWAMPQNYHWVLQYPRQLENPIPCKGKLGFFEVSLAVLED